MKVFCIHLFQVLIEMKDQLCTVDIHIVEEGWGKSSVSSHLEVLVGTGLGLAGGSLHKGSLPCLVCVEVVSCLQL